METKNQLIIFIKNPVVGKVKTRLAETIGNEKALQIYLQLTAYTLKQTSKIQAKKNIFYSDKILHDYSADNYYLQAGNDLGERMNNAFKVCFEENKQSKIIILGTDCAELNPEIINTAFEQLENNDIVIGPARDGGYYLLGMKNIYSDLFHSVEWSTNSVFQTTMNKANKLKLTVYELPILTDIDTEEDLATLPKDFGYL